jgi:voltage-gated potassium channel Kch
LQRLREFAPRAPIVLVDRSPDHPRLQALLAKYAMTLVVGDINSPITLGLLQLAHARRVVLLTGHDLTNLNAAASILDLVPALAGRVVLHVSNLRLLRSMGYARASRDAAVFNSHAIAARHLVEQYLLERFASTAHLDTVVLAGFGRFGQSVLEVLQERASGGFSQLIVVDNRAQDKLNAFIDHVGVRGDYAQKVVTGNLLDCAIWAELDGCCELRSKAPLIIVGADDDMVNLEGALWLRRRYPDAFIVARHFQRSSFSAQIARDCDVVLFSIADLIAEAIPAEWCAAPRSAAVPPGPAQPRASAP